MARLIAKAQQQDAHAIHQLIAGVLGSYGLYHLRPPYVDDDVNDLEGSYFNNKGYFWVLKNEAENIIACTGVYKLDETVCELRKMYLKTEEQGNGIGRLLLQTAIEKSKTLGYKKILLKTNSNLTRAIELYKKYGFTAYPISEKDQKEDCDVAMALDFTKTNTPI